MMSLSDILLGNSLLLRNTFGRSCGFKLLRCHSGASVVSIGRYFWWPTTTKAVAKRREQQQSRPRIPNVRFFDGRNIATSKLQAEAPDTHEFRSVQNHKPEQVTADAKALGWPAVVIAFDIETTGFSREDRIVEVAFRDLLGGKNSTLQTLVNPEKEVRNFYVHGITTEMVTKPGVPRMKDLIPILLKYVESRRIDGKPVVFVAHNGRTFDVPFFIREFNRCSIEFPLDWLFIDTLPIARKLVTKDGKRLSKVSLQALSEHYGIRAAGPSHRAMQDVSTLCLILQKMSFELKLSVADLMEGAFRRSDILTGSTRKD